MKSIGIRLALAGALSLAVATVAAATQKAEKIAIQPGSERAALIIKAVDVPISPPYQTGYRLTLSKYDAEHEAMQGGPYGGKAVFDAKTKLFYDGYLVMDVKPGTYVISDFSRQDRWALCFNENSVQFTVSPGEVLYLGELDAVGHVRELERKAVSSGRLIYTSSPIHFFDDVTPPMLKPVSEDDLAAVRRMMQARMPRTTVEPKAAAFRPARFGTGRNLLGMSRICGGYYTGSAQPRS
jgi:hypothetical protein